MTRSEPDEPARHPETADKAPDPAAPDPETGDKTAYTAAPDPETGGAAPDTAAPAPRAEKSGEPATDLEGDIEAAAGRDVPAAGSAQVRRRLLRAVTARPGPAQLLIGVLLFALGFAVVTQARQTSTAGLAGLRQSELVRLLDDVTERRERLEVEHAALQERLSALTSSRGSIEEARAAALERRDTYAILAGTVAVSGPGITVTVRDPERGVRATDLLNAVQELRDAKAEAIQIGDVRVVADTPIIQEGDQVRIGDGVVAAPYRIVAIGDPDVLEPALRIPGGVVEDVEQRDASIVIARADPVLIDAVIDAPEARWATPDTSPAVREGS